MIRNLTLRDFYRPVDVASLAFWRIAFGLLMAWDMVKVLQFEEIRIYYAEAEYHFSYNFFTWVRPLPEPWTTILHIVVGIFGILVALGLFYRFAAAGLCLTYTYTFLMEKCNYNNHYYLMCLLAGLMILIPAHRAWSLDRILFKDKRPETAPVWGVWLLRFQLGLVYFYAAIAKINYDWMVRAEPISRWLSSRSDRPFIGPVMAWEPIGPLFAYSGFLFDLLIAPALLWKPTRKYAFIAAALFHGTNSIVFDIGIFPALALAATSIFFEPDWPRRVWGTLTRQFIPRVPEERPPDRLLGRQKALLAFLAFYCLLQALIPFRHHLYPGDVAWTEEGHQWSWRMKLRSKDALVRYFVTDPATGLTWVADVQDHFTAQQIRNHSKDPDMLIQMGHFIADIYRRREGIENLEVRAEANLRLNYGTTGLLVDPDVDLAAQRLGLLPKPWILERPPREPPNR
ncbi:MAG: HTTM domain-containing protein [Sumerlaeia bacterium]